jgi:hypothetical protein
VIDDHVPRADGRERVGFPAAHPRLAVDAGADADVADDHVVRLHVDPPRMKVIPGEGAVWPAMVRRAR